MKLRTLLTATVACAALMIPAANAYVILGNTEADLLGGDLTDPENDGVKGSLTFDGFDAVFTANEEPQWNNEGAWNVFDNQTTANGDKWCCGSGGANLPFWVSATFDNPVVLSHFTVTNGNDSNPSRDPRAWRIQGSNNGDAGPFTDIFVQGVDGTTPSLWTSTKQVIRFNAGAVLDGGDGGTVDFLNPAAYTTIRYQTDATSGSTGAHHHLGELEYFGTVIPEPSAFALVGLAGLGLVLRRRR